MKGGESIAKQPLQWTPEDHKEQRSGERNVDSRFQIQLQKDETVTTQDRKMSCKLHSTGSTKVYVTVNYTVMTNNTTQ